MIGTLRKEKQHIKRSAKPKTEFNAYHTKKMIVERTGGFFFALLIMGLCFLILQPILNQISVAIMDRSNLFDPTVIAVPRNLSSLNFVMAMDFMNYWPTLFRTIGVTLAVAILQIVSCALAAYGFARHNFPFKRIWFTAVLLTIIVPPQVIMAPLFLNFRFFDFFGIIRATTGDSINLLDTLTGYMLMVATGMGLRSGLYIFMLRQYFRGVPRDLEEAAYLDGCGRLRTFVQIMVPDAMPILVSCFLFAFVWQWTDTMYASMFLNQTGVLSLSVGSLAENFRLWWINTYGHAHVPPMAIMQAMIATGMLLTTIPLIILYAFTQRAFVESIGTSGIKM